jgi:hypothetical protein
MCYRHADAEPAPDSPAATPAAAAAGGTPKAVDKDIDPPSMTVRGICWPELTSVQQLGVM